MMNWVILVKDPEGNFLELPFWGSRYQVHKHIQSLEKSLLPFPGFVVEYREAAQQTGEPKR
jgi:hypothetical protein